MPEKNPPVREVAWPELFPWLILVRSIRIALLARVIILGAIGVLAITLGLRAIGWLFSTQDDPVLREMIDVTHRWVWERSPGFTIAMSARSAGEILSSAWDGLLEAPIAMWMYFIRPFVDLFNDELTPLGFFYLLLCCVWELLVWGLVGGAITRIAALKFTRDEGPGFSYALRHAASKLMSYSAAPLIALAGASVFAVQLVVLGLLMRFELVAMLAGIVWPFVLLLGLLMAILLVGALLGWPLMWATVSVEGTDAFDALSRSYAYVYQRPLRLLWYVVFAGILAALSMFVVKAFAATAIALGDWSISWGLDQSTVDSVVAPEAAAKRRVVRDSISTPPPIESDATVTLEVPVARGSDSDVENSGEIASGSRLSQFTRGAIHFWKSMMAALAAGYQAGFLWVSAVGVYLLLRRDIDGAELDEVYLGHEDEFGVPPLEDDATTGVPEVTPSSAAVPGDASGNVAPPPV